jgi:hypothetical protein
MNLNERLKNEVDDLRGALIGARDERDDLLAENERLKAVIEELLKQAHDKASL